MNINQFTVKQLKESLIELYHMDDNLAAYQLCFKLLLEKIGEEAFDKFMAEQGF